MWSYYGSKANVVNFYPPPRYSKIIEPFAGTARYSLKYFDRDVTLVDKYSVITDIWKWLQACSRDDILKLPRLKEGEKIDDFKFDCKEAKLLIGFLCGKGAEAPRKTASARATTHRPNYINFSLKRIANDLFKIRHWKIVCGDYKDIENESATWFIDPPYQFGGYVYKENNKGWSYSALADWCRSRDGQIIVCENTKADWLPFLPMREMRGSVRKTTEAIWCNEPHQYQMQQAPLFEGMNL